MVYALNTKHVPSSDPVTTVSPLLWFSIWSEVKGDGKSFMPRIQYIPWNSECQDCILVAHPFLQALACSGIPKSQRSICRTSDQINRIWYKLHLYDSILMWVQANLLVSNPITLFVDHFIQGYLPRVLKYDEHDVSGYPKCSLCCQLNQLQREEDWKLVRLSALALQFGGPWTNTLTHRKKQPSLSNLSDSQEKQ